MPPSTSVSGALLVVDVQNDFCPGGSLAVAEGDRVLPVLNAYLQWFAERGQPIYASRDWHPAQTRHFQVQGGQWPVHCVQNTPGAAFHPDLRLPSGTIVVSKGADPNEDSYSAFEALEADGTSLAESLRSRGVLDLFVGGLATDYCVRASTLDALRAGLKATMLLDAVRGVNLKPHDAEVAIQEMVAAGAAVTTFELLAAGR